MPIASKEGAPSQSVTSSLDASPKETAEAKPKKKKTKPSGKALSGKEPTKKKKKSKKKGGNEIYPAFDDDDEDSDSIQDKPRNSKSSSSAKPRSSKKKAKGKSSKSSRREEDEDDNGRNKDENDDSDSSEEENEDDKDQGNGEPPQFLLYYDPKTNSIGRINREQAIAKSTLIVDKSKEAEAEAAYADAYKNVIESQTEKQQLIVMLKKLERQKPGEESWLDKIKKEKQAGKGNTQQKKFKSTAGISRRSSIQNDSVVTFDSSAGSSASKRNSISGKPLSCRSPVAMKPKSSGWSKPTSSRSLRTAEKPQSNGWSKPTSTKGLKQ